MVVSVFPTVDELGFLPVVGARFVWLKFTQSPHECVILTGIDMRIVSGSMPCFSTIDDLVTCGRRVISDPVFPGIESPLRFHPLKIVQQIHHHCYVVGKEDVVIVPNQEKFSVTLVRAEVSAFPQRGRPSFDVEQLHLVMPINQGLSLISVQDDELLGASVVLVQKGVDRLIEQQWTAVGAA